MRDDRIIDGLAGNGPDKIGSRTTADRAEFHDLLYISKAAQEISSKTH
jgi:hypothetical protein